MNLIRNALLSALAIAVTSAASSSPAFAADAPAASDIAANPALLSGTRWMMALPKESDCEVPPEVAFKKDGSIEGNAGCNDFTGDWKAEGKTLKVERKNTSSRNCGPKFLALEKAFGGALDKTAALRAEGNLIALLDADGEVLARITPAVAGACD